MRLDIIHIVAALGAAIAFALAFMAASIAVVSAIFMAMGLAAIIWVAWSILHRQATRGR